MGLSEISEVSQVLPFLFGMIISFKFGFTKSKSIFLIVLCIWSVSEIYCLLNPGKHNGYVYNLHWVLSTLFLIYYFKEITKLKVYTLSLLYVLFIFILVIQFGFLASFYSWNMPVVYLSSFMMIILSSYSLILMVDDASEYLFRSSAFWISATLLFYYTASLVSFSLFPEALTVNDKKYDYFWDIHSSVNIISNLLYTYGFLQRF
jgi:hypothetical protein